MIHQFELNKLDCSNTCNELLSVIENICDQYCLEDHFGTISMAVNELVDLIKLQSASNKMELSVVFLIQSNMFSVTFNANLNFLEIIQEINSTTPYCDNISLFTFSKLVDFYEVRNNGSELYMEFHVKPYFQCSQHEASELLLNNKNRIFQNKFSDQ